MSGAVRCARPPPTWSAVPLCADEGAAVGGNIERPAHSGRGLAHCSDGFGSVGAGRRLGLGSVRDRAVRHFCRRMADGAVDRPTVVTQANGHTKQRRRAGGGLVRGHSNAGGRLARCALCANQVVRPWRSSDGSISRSIRPETHWLQHGAVVLADLPGFVPQVEGGPRAEDPKRPGVRRPGHTLDNIRHSLTDVLAPPGFALPAGLTAFDVFAGYMVFDALIANADRHEHNWATLTPPLQNVQEAIAPSYDHATSLGHNLQEDRRRLYLTEAWRLENFVRKGRAVRFEHTGTAPTLVGHAAKAVAMCADEGAHWIRTRLHTLDLAPVFETLDNGDIPVMSEVAARFAHDLLDLNLRRLRDATGHSD